jgi:hypothetical protein
MNNRFRSLTAGYLVLLAVPLLNAVLVIGLGVILGVGAYCLWSCAWLGGTMLIIKWARSQDDQLIRRHRNIALILLVLIMIIPFGLFFYGATIPIEGAGGHAAIGPALEGLSHMLIGMMLYGVFYVLAILVSIWGIITLTRRST